MEGAVDGAHRCVLVVVAARVVRTRTDGVRLLGRIHLVVVMGWGNAFYG